MNAIAKILTSSIICLSIATGINHAASAQQKTPITVDTEAKAPVKREAPTDPLTVALCNKYWGTAAKLVEQQIATLPPTQQQSAYAQQLKSYRVHLMALEYGVLEVNQQDFVTLGCVEAEPEIQQVTGTVTRSN
jgi:hypothetical protein